VLAEAPIARLNADGPSESDRPIDVNELVAGRSIADLNEAAERYFASLTDWEYQLTKPFSSADEAPSLLMNVGVLLQGLRVMPGATVLEFGAGTGWLARCLTQLGCRVILLDVSHTALKMARELYERLPPIGDRPAPEFMIFDGEHLDLPDGSVDRVMSFHAFHHVANPEGVLSELSRVLRPGGIAAFAEPGPRHSITEESQFEMRLSGVVENDIDVHALWRAARARGFRDLKVMIAHGPPFHVSLDQFEDLLAGGRTSAAWADSTREYLRNVRNFFLVKDGVERVDSRHAGALACEIHAALAAGPASDSSPVSFDLMVTNTSGAVWLPQDAPYGGVAIGVHIYDSAKTVVAAVVLPDRLAEPGREIPPGETRRLRVSLPPQPAGRYLFEFDCVASRVAWFAQMGSHPSTVEVEVTAATAPGTGAEASS
jgi:SAM-dependent methyltransferase